VILDLTPRQPYAGLKPGADNMAPTEGAPESTY